MHSTNIYWPNSEKFSPRIPNKRRYLIKTNQREYGKLTMRIRYLSVRSYSIMGVRSHIRIYFRYITFQQMLHEHIINLSNHCNNIQCYVWLETYSNWNLSWRERYLVRVRWLSWWSLIPYLAYIFHVSSSNFGKLFSADIVHVVFFSIFCHTVLKT